MNQINRKEVATTSYPTKIVQFGEGNFMRAFVDWQIDQLNETANLNAGVSIIRPIDYDALPLLNTQDGLYTTIVRGIDERGEAVEQTRIISCVNEEIPVYKEFDRFMELAQNKAIEVVFSNTTEAGIEYIDTDSLSDAPAKAFPAKLTQWLFKRFTFFNGSADAGLIIIPCELIDYNGEKLKEIVLKYCQLWELEAAFVDWLNTANHFCSTLVDRIVTGFPRDQHDELQQRFGYQDNFMVTCEYFHLFVIQGPEKLKDVLHLHDCSLNIKVVEDIYPYKQRKVAILNGAHTAMVPLAYMAGLNTVGESMDDALISAYVETLISDEIIPTLDLPKQELESFANDVIKRFKNPYIQHQLMAISLNSMSKFRTRVLPQLKRYVAANSAVPQLMAHALAGLILFHRGTRDGSDIELADNSRWLELFSDLWKQYESRSLSLEDLVRTVMEVQWHWEENLLDIPDLHASVTDILTAFLDRGVPAVLAETIGSVKS